MRLDDACERMDVCKWKQIEKLLDKYGIHPLVGVIPHCEDTMMDKYEFDADFWSKVESWEKKGWTIALHGYNHVYTTECGGLNPVNKRSEFAGVSLEVQKDKIRKGIEIFRNHGINPRVFFAPSHTFDENTLIALKEESDIRIISDTIAWNNYVENVFSFVPQQSGSVRKLPFAITTFCYHPNMMSEQHFVHLENFIGKFFKKFIDFPNIIVPRKKNCLDKLLNYLYMRKHK
jgi:predicted deacetylase